MKSYTCYAKAARVGVSAVEIIVLFFATTFLGTMPLFAHGNVSPSTVLERTIELQPTPVPLAGVAGTEVRTQEGWVFTLTGIDLLTSIETNTQRFRPESEVYVVLLGTLTNSTDKNGCVSASAFAITSADIEVSMDRRYFDPLSEAYNGRSFPGYWNSQCLDYDETAETFLVFDVPLDGYLYLHFDEEQLPLGRLDDLQQGIRSLQPTATPVPTRTPTATHTPTRTPRPTKVPTATRIPSPIPTEVQIAALSATVLKDANLRSGPSTDYPVVGSAAAAQQLTVVGLSKSRDWYLTDTGGWIAAFLVEVSGDVASIPISSSTVVQATPAIQTNRIKPGIAEAVYAEEFVPALEFYLDGMNEFIERVVQVGEDPLLFLDNDWRLEVAAAIVWLRIADDPIRELVPPPSLQGVHELAIEALDHFEAAYDHFLQGLDNLDGEEMGLAASEMEIGSQKFVEAESLLRSILPE